jgi:CBS domain-containing protein
MKVRDVMTKHVNLVGPGTTLAVAARRMRDEGIGCLPVGEPGGPLIGIVTDRDMVVRAIAAGKDVSQLPVHEIMSTEVVSCFEDQEVEDARRIMVENQVRRLPVLDRRRRLVGIVSIHDLAGGGMKPKPYQVTFYKSLTSSQGQARNVPLETVYVMNRHSRDDAVAAAIRKFERDRAARPWHALADGYEVIEPS